MAKPKYTLSQVIGQLNSGELWWGATNVTFSFPATLSPDHSGVSDITGFSTLTLAQRAAARVAVQSHNEIVALTFTEVSGNGGDIRFHNVSGTDSYAFAYFPDGGWGYGGDVFFNRDYAGPDTSDLVTPTRGDHGFSTYLHELGHAMGLRHPGNYNAGDGVQITYAKHAKYYQDSLQYTVMSYFEASNTGADHSYDGETAQEAETLLLHDIAALHAMYGADPLTRKNASTYGFASNLGISSPYNFAINRDPVVCIYDAGGIDTLNFSGFSANTVLDLNPGSFSNTQLMTRNVSIAFGTIIENAVGGSGADLIRGNSVGNLLRGQNGNDTIHGLLGNDILDGGAGVDKLYGGGGNDIYKLVNTTDTVIDTSGIDTITSTITRSLMAYLAVENLRLLGAASIAATGNARANALFGNNGANVLDGGYGNDSLDGGLGADTLRGGAGNDVYVLGNARDTVIDTQGIDTITSTITRSLVGYTVIEDLTLLGTAGIVATGNARGNVLTGNAGANLLNGSTGNDSLSGLGGADRLVGGTGRDVLRGGLGNDYFLYNAASDSLASGLRDIIDDFDDLGDDTINLAGVSGAVLDYKGSAAFDAAGQVRIVASGTGVMVLVNLDTNIATQELQILLTGTTTASMTAGDFIL